MAEAEHPFILGSEWRRPERPGATAVIREKVDLRGVSLRRTTAVKNDQCRMTMSNGRICHSSF